LGSHAAALGQMPALQGAAGQLDQGIGAALVTTALIVGAGRPGQWLQGRGQDLAGLGVQQPLQVWGRQTFSYCNAELSGARTNELGDDMQSMTDLRRSRAASSIWRPRGGSPWPTSAVAPHSCRGRTNKLCSCS
jgi:hypothetical protein